MGLLREGDNGQGRDTGHHQGLLVPKRPQQVGLWLSALETFISASSAPSPLLCHTAPSSSGGILVAEKGALASLTPFPASFRSDDNECLRNPCEGRGRCVNSVGSYSCLCYPGYTLATLGDTQECQGE